MNIVDEIIRANVSFLQKNHPVKLDKIPRWKTAIVTCMDTRLVNLLESAAGIERGDVKMIKIAGNVVGRGLNDVIKSLMVCVYELQVREIIVIGHYECGMEKTSSESMAEHMRERGINEDIIADIKPTLKNWADLFCRPEQNVIDSVNNIRSCKYLPADIPVHGFIIHPATGKLDLIAGGSE